MGPGRVGTLRSIRTQGGERNDSGGDSLGIRDTKDKNNLIKYTNKVKYRAWDRTKLEVPGVGRNCLRMEKDKKNVENYNSKYLEGTKKYQKYCIKLKRELYLQQDVPHVPQPQRSKPPQQRDC